VFQIKFGTKQRNKRSAEFHFRILTFPEFRLDNNVAVLGKQNVGLLSVEKAEPKSRCDLRETDRDISA